MRTARTIIQSLCPCIVGAVIALSAPQALAQNQLPSTLPAKQTLSTGDKSTIAAFVDNWAPRLSDPDPEAATRAMEALSRPLDEADVSVSFRLEYSSALAPILDNLIRDDNARLAHVGATLAGKCGTTRSANTLKRALRDDRPAVRYAAATGYRHLLDPVFADQTLAIGDRQIPDIYSDIEDAIEAETHPHVVAGLITVFSGAAGASNDAASDQALTALASGTGKLASRLASSPPLAGASDWDRAIYRSIKQAYDVSLQQQIERGQISTEFARQAGIASGLALAYVQERLQTADFSDEADTASLADLAELAENFLVIVNNEINAGGAITGGKARRAAERAIDDADPNRFADAIGDYMSVIQRSPYSVPADRLPQ